MPLFFIVVGLVAVVVLWWYRRKMLNEAANDAAEALGRARRAVRGERQRGLNGASPLPSIDDPVVAAAALLASIASDGVEMAPQRETALRKEISAIAAAGKADAAVDYALWATGRIDDTAMVIDRLAPFLRDRLDEAEKGDLLTMIRRVATAGGPPLPMLEPRMHRLRQKLGVVVN
ncbi:hypothetical protein MesoLjLc_20340 [Mesorhizobium sp. L-8-10]|uniref:hypothetical protein n=1 Tax=unclassified Mesorhizobium TaxID=325217 RepID=UPI001926A0C8|nr:MULTISPECIES: hypothetical protein [unclassified Mesorhizobium]BCH22291.1 hypothetical protein MesoLjLb_20760 [Mesorhizobium sp. L-8-3]BCH30104.1 hypothetical protein MesoLjLc_20340 [Mesorhizobium sp. L-8-10]